MTDLRQAAQQALEVEADRRRKALAAEMRAALAKQAEPVEPVAKCIDDICSEHFGRVEAFDYLPRDTLLYTAPPQRKPLTEEEIDAVWDQWFGAYGLRGSNGPYTRRGFARAIEEAIWKKNS